MADSTSPTTVNQNLPKFDTDEVLWYDNGIWGTCGYAIPNPMSKTLTSNDDIYELHTLVGMTLFDLLHRRDAVCFVRPPHKQYWYDLHQIIVVARKRLNDLTRQPNDSNGLTVVHAQPAPRMFVVYPVPFFGDRIRNPDIRKYATIGMLMLSEIMQHSDNDIVGYVTPSFTGIVGQYLQEILAQMAMKFFGYTRAQAYDPAFTLATQSGKAVGFLSYPTPRAPLWPGALLNDRMRVSYTSPHRSGHDGGQAYTNFGVQWTYHFESAVPLVGQPNTWS